MGEKTTSKRDIIISQIKNYIKDNNLYEDMDVCSYLAGMICHYVLDSNIHPYIVYKTGVFDKKKKNTYKYNHVHDFMEAFIDNDMVKRREKINPYKFRLDQFCFNTREFSDNLNSAINYSFKETFYIDNMSSIYYKSLNYDTSLELANIYANEYQRNLNYEISKDKIEELIKTLDINKYGARGIKRGVKKLISDSIKESKSIRT